MVVKSVGEVKEKNYSLETGKWAKQANGSVVLRWCNMVMVASSTASKKSNPDLDFFPLTVDYREKFYAAGQFAGGFFKREGKPSTKEVLISRLTDRPLRPLFPKNFLNELQIFITLLSADPEEIADIHVVTCASASLMASNIPFDTPVAGVRVGRVDGELILFPTMKQMSESDLDILLAGSKDTVTMIEGSAKEIAEEEMLEAIKFGHEEIKKLCELQFELRKSVTEPVMVVPEKEENLSLKQEIHDTLFKPMSKLNQAGDKKKRQEGIDQLVESYLDDVKKKLEDDGTDETAKDKYLSEAKYLIEQLEVAIVREQIFKDKVRADGRKLDEIRPIEIELGTLPSAHGSAIFTRGETQSLGVVTLGARNHAQVVDDVTGEYKQYFYLHYNFLPFSVGEVRRYGGPGRREIGHGKLAENAVVNLIPDESDFPYVIRVVSEILESNGSSSMATVCSASLALMDAGVPITRSVAGIAMGLISDDDGNHAILSDIAGLEDHFGDMDFKVAGTEEGITAFQMDTKVSGISYEVMKDALEQAKAGRITILSKMNTCISSHRVDLPEHAPTILSTQIPKDSIGELIGPGGSNIRAIMEKTGAEINVQEDGLVYLYSIGKEGASQAKKMVDLQFTKVELHKIYQGTVRKITNFGAFIEILPGKSGLCHISQIANRRIGSVEEVLQEGEEVQVKVIALDSRQGKISLSLKDVNQQVDL